MPDEALTRDDCNVPFQESEQGCLLEPEMGEVVERGSVRTG